MTAYLEEQMIVREKLGNLRHLQMIEGLIDFSSNDYLGEARSLELKSNVLMELDRQISHLNGFGSTGSRLLTGNSLYAEKLEKQIAAFHGFEAGLLFTCGYMANVGLISSIASCNDTIIYDLGVHASTHEGLYLSLAKTLPFRHHDLEHLEGRLKRCIKGNKYIVVESIYSTDGRTADLTEICRLAKKYEAFVIVDEAHAVGVHGPLGKGLVAKENLCAEVFAVVVTFGKALGTMGAIVLGSEKLRHGLINFSKPSIYSTSLPFISLAAIKASYERFPDLNNQRERLFKLIQVFRENIKSSSNTQIQSVKFRGNEKVKWASKWLLQKGFDVRAILNPTVKRGSESLRICLHAFNSDDEVYTLSKYIQEIL